MKNNPFHGHPGSSVKAVEEFAKTGLIKEVGNVKTPMLIIREKLDEAGLIQEVHAVCEVCLSSPDECEELKRCLQELTNQGAVQISRSKFDENIVTLEPLEIPYSRQDAQESPLVICFPTPFPFESTKAVP